MRTDTRQKIVNYLARNKMASAHSLTEYLGLSQRAVFKQLQRLLDDSLISKIGKAPKVYYHLAGPVTDLKVPFRKTWQLIEEEDYANYQFVTPTWEGYTKMAKIWGFVNGSYLGAAYHNRSCHLFAAKLAYDNANQVHFAMLFNQPKAWDRLHRVTMANSAKLFAWAEKQQKKAADRLSDRQLVAIIEAFNRWQRAVHCPRGPMWLLETPYGLVSNYLRSYLEEQAQEIGRTTIKPSLAFQVMGASLHDSVWSKEEASLVNVAAITDRRRRESALAKHAKQYEWLEYGLEGRVIPADDFRERLNKIIANGAQRTRQKLTKEKRTAIDDQKRIIREYQIDAKHQKVFAIVRESTAARLYSKDSQFFGYYALEHIFREFGRRANLSLEQVRFLAPADFRSALLAKTDFRRLTKERMAYGLHVSNEGRTVFYHGETAKKIWKIMPFFRETKAAADGETIKGQPAYGGLARGRVKIVNTINEIFKVHTGNILVSRMTNPSIVPAMKKAAAIVTDLGGITCHAAIIARELKKPCLIGTGSATKRLKDNDLIEVDADAGTIKLLDSNNRH
ncbi:MAG: PEP-utilizing enzyme [Patescibacteria group bacterium]